MVGKNATYSSVPTAPDFDNNSNLRKYTVNKDAKGNISISKPACALFVMGALILAAVAAIVTYFLVPNCDGHSLPESLTKMNEKIAEKTVHYTRLPKSIQPMHYRLFIVPELEGNFTTRGNVTIKLKISEETNTIRLNSLDLNIDEHSTKVIQKKDGKELKISRQSQDESDQTYTITLNDYLNENEEYELFLKFTGFLNDYMVGFYKSYYVKANGETRWLASTQFSPTDARRAFPCFDEMSFKAKFQINIGRPADRVSLSNMEVDYLTSENNITWDHYKETPLMSTYILAFAVHDFKPYRQGINNFTIWTREDHLWEALFAGEIGPRILKYFEGYFNTSFPLNKLDIITLPDFGFSAMENFGLITFRETKLLYNDLTSTTENQRDVALILAHELAHQWFGNLVTPKWWDDLWIKEGFATYFQYFGVDTVEPLWQIMDEFYQFQTLEAFKSDQFSSARPIHFKVQNSNDIRQAFDQISYQKGAALVRMLVDILGKDTFRNGLRQFIAKYQYSNANDIDLWAVLTEQAHLDNVLGQNQTVKEIMRTWMVQPGYPVVTVTSNNSTNQLTLTQKRFLINGESKSEKWWIPISYTTDLKTIQNSTSSQPILWLPPDQSVTIENVSLSGWHLLNFHQTGYYIVNYDEQNWKKLLNDVMKLPPGTIAQLISDSMDLARAGLLDYDVPLKLITTVGRNDHDLMYEHLLAIFDRTNYLHNVLRATSIYGQFELFFSDILAIAFEAVQFDESPHDNYLRKRIRSIVLQQACRKSDSKCTVDARFKYRDWMNKDIIIPPNEREIVYCTAIREGGHPEWKAAYNAYLKANSSSDKLILLKSLGCSSEHWLLARLLDMLIVNNSVIRKQDGAEVFKSVATNFHGHNLAFDFLRNKWDDINKYYGVAFRAVSKMVESLSTFMNSEHQLQQLESFRKENHYNLQATEQAFDHTIEKIKANIHWMKTNYKSVADWLEVHLKHFDYKKK